MSDVSQIPPEVPVPSRSELREPRRGVPSTGPGVGAGFDRDPGRASILNARIVVVATVVIGQLWALTVELDAWYLHHMREVWLILAFQAASFLVALGLWFFGHER